MRLDPSGCVNTAICGEPKVWEIPTRSAPRLPTTRRGMAELDKKISKASEAGDYVVVEVANMHSERFMMGLIVKDGVAQELEEEEEEEDTWLGHFKEGDEVLRVTKLEPLAPGSVTFENRDEDNRRDSVMLVFRDDVHMALREGRDFTASLPVHRATRHNPAFPRITLKPEAHSTILQLISPVTANPNDLHRPDRARVHRRGERQPDEGRGLPRLAGWIWEAHVPREECDEGRVRHAAGRVPLDEAA